MVENAELSNEYQYYSLNTVTSMLANKEDGLLYIYLSLTAMTMLDDDHYQGCQPCKSLLGNLSKENGNSNDSTK